MGTVPEGVEGKGTRAHVAGQSLAGGEVPLLSKRQGVSRAGAGKCGIDGGRGGEGRGTPGSGKLLLIPLSPL